MLSLQSFGQLRDTAGLSAGKLKKISINAERYGDYYTALNYYSAYAAKKQNTAEVQYKLGSLYEKNRDYKNAAETYMKAYGLDEKNPQALYDHIRMVKMTGDIEKARVEYKSFEDNIRKMGYHNNWKRILRTEIASCDTALALIADSLPVKITNLGPEINGPHQDFAPIPISDSEFVFGSLRENEIKYFSVDSTTTRRHLYISNRDEQGWSPAQHWDVPFNNTDYQVVNGSFNRDGDLFICTRCQENWKREMTCKLWSVKKENGDWQSAQLLPEEINGEGLIVTQPAMAYDQRKERDVLYFSSNSPDGKGGMDIFYTYFDTRKNAWSRPRNLGRRINGEGDEITPFFNQKEKKLYFSSSSYSGMGGIDIYSSRGELSRFGKPINMGYPINSTVDDFYFVLNDDRESGFLVSNRAGGYQMMNETCCDDIYEFKIDDVVHIDMEGFVMRVDEEDYAKGEGDKLSSKAFNTNFLDDVQVDLYLIEEDQEVLMERFKTSGDGTFKVNFESEKQYKVVLSKEGFFSNNIDVDTRGISESETIHQNIGLSEISGRSIVMGNINYEFDSAELTSESRYEIDKGILNILRENPGIVVEISSHTDNRGELKYNTDLSQRRAENVIKYLTERGIASDRLQAKGYGESNPIAPNTNSDGSDNPEGRAENRRTEFKILENRKTLSDEDDENEE
ncbi:OmpA family protein [Cryomorpha ignava]|uniref:OmpA family protein n=1 Tax=Cryomorpha ignava TaxID=101383 RepID=A0A7K3WN32_9FLAO|nr:OmpA family protein [Cryomorpha ignava]NEN23059.1 OmpA family protein [Cryomorpha ignava]